jgi:flagellar biosynthesis GTPase FlhF
MPMPAPGRGARRVDIVAKGALQRRFEPKGVTMATTNIDAGRMPAKALRAAALALLVSVPGLAAAQGMPGGAAAAGESVSRPRMTQEQREAERRRWQAMSAEERQKAVEERRARRAEARERMTPEERQRADARRQAARERAANMTPEERAAQRARAAERRGQPTGQATN